MEWTKSSMKLYIFDKVQIDLENILKMHLLIPAFTDSCDI